MEKQKSYFLDKKENVQRVLYGFYALCIALFLADFIIHRHVYHSWENIPAFYAIFGFIACVILVFGATQMRKILMRGEDYYDQKDSSHD